MARTDNFMIFVDEELIQPRKDELYENFRLLWIKVILRAAYDWVLYKDSKGRAAQRVAEGAYRWLFEDHIETIKVVVDNKVVVKLTRPFNSLIFLCTELDLDIETVRSFARSLSKKEIRKLEFFTRHRKQRERKKIVAVDDVTD